MYKCECGREFDNRYSYSSHKGVCKSYISRVFMTDDEKEIELISSSGKYREKKWIELVLDNKINPYNGGFIKMKRILHSHGYKEWKCEKCGNTEWMGSWIPLEVHHIDGNKKNNNLGNIMFLCPNCHAQTNNYRWGGAETS